MTHIASTSASFEHPGAGEVAVLFADRTYAGQWTVDGDMLTVHWRGESRSAPLGGMASRPETLARLLLVQLLRSPPQNK